MTAVELLIGDGSTARRAVGSRAELVPVPFLFRKLIHLGRGNHLGISGHGVLYVVIKIQISQSKTPVPRSPVAYHRRRRYVRCGSGVARMSCSNSSLFAICVCHAVIPSGHESVRPVPTYLAPARFLNRIHINTHTHINLPVCPLACRLLPAPSSRIRVLSARWRERGATSSHSRSQSKPGGWTPSSAKDDLTCRLASLRHLRSLVKRLGNTVKGP